LGSLKKVYNKLQPLRQGFLNLPFVAPNLITPTTVFISALVFPSAPFNRSSRIVQAASFKPHRSSRIVQAASFKHNLLTSIF